MAKATQLCKTSIILLIRGYQLAISPLLGHHCRFFPTCSQYMIEAVTTYGTMHGVWLGIKRLLRCHPGCAGGVDPLPRLTKENISHD